MSRLIVEEHPLEAPPSSPEETEDWFHTADGPTDEILAAHQIYCDSAGLLLPEDNRLLERFGHRLELAQCGDPCWTAGPFTSSSKAARYSWPTTAR